MSWSCSSRNLSSLSFFSVFIVVSCWWLRPFPLFPNHDWATGYEEFVVCETICCWIDLCHVDELRSLLFCKHVIYLVPMFGSRMLPGILEVILELEDGTHYWEQEAGTEFKQHQPIRIHFSRLPGHLTSLNAHMSITAFSSSLQMIAVARSGLMVESLSLVVQAFHAAKFNFFAPL